MAIPGISLHTGHASVMISGDKSDGEFARESEADFLGMLRRIEGHPPVGTLLLAPSNWHPPIGTR